MWIKGVEKVIHLLSEGGIYLLLSAAVGLLALIFYEEGSAGVWATISVDVAEVLGKFVVMMAIFFTITGSINHLYKTHPGKFHEVISGKYGMVAMISLAAIMPGPAGGQQLQDAWNTPGTDRVNVLLCLAAMMGASITMFMFRSKFIGTTLTLIWFGIAVSFIAQIWAVGRMKSWVWFT